MPGGIAVKLVGVRVLCPFPLVGLFIIADDTLMSVALK